MPPPSRERFTSPMLSAYPAEVMRRAIPIVLATVLTGCSAESPSPDASTGGQGGGDGTGDPSDGANSTSQGVSTGRSADPLYCWDCGAGEKECRNESDDGYACGSRPYELCAGCYDICVCPNGLECVGATCQPRACNGMEASPLPDCSRCTQTECCDELEACFAAPDGCLDAAGDIRVDTQDGEHLRNCQIYGCADACNVVCSRLELAADDHDAAECANDRCCDAFAACHGYDDWDACLSCIESGGGDLCDAVLACVEECAAT